MYIRGASPVALRNPPIDNCTSTTEATRMNLSRILRRQASGERESGTDQTRCGECDRPLAEPGDLDPASREPCPHCGSTSRRFIRNLSETLELHGSIRVQQRRPGVSGGPILDA